MILQLRKNKKGKPSQNNHPDTIAILKKLSNMTLQKRRKSHLLHTSLRHIRILRSACCSASTFAFNSEIFGPEDTLGALGSSGTDVDRDLFEVDSDGTDKEASIRRSKNKDRSSFDGPSTL